MPLGATVFTDMISARSGTVTPPKPVLPRIEYETKMTTAKKSHSGRVSSVTVLRQPITSAICG